MTSVLPNFLVIGAMKAGTTSLYRYLCQHPQVLMPQTKELDFFVEEEKWKLGRGWYERQFQGLREDVIAVGEASTGYSKYPKYSGVPGRIAMLLPDVRLIYLVRHPVERMLSHYLHMALSRREPEPIERALLANPEYVNTSRYALQIEQYLKHFPRERLLVIKSEDLRDMRAETMRRIYGFLGVDSTYVPPTLSREFFRTSERRRYRPLVRAIRRTPVRAAAARLLPRFFKRKLRRIVTVPAVDPEKVGISLDLRHRLEELVRDDVKRLRAYMDERFDGWGIG